MTEAILYHQDFQGRHYFHHFDMDPNLRDNYRDMPWYDLAERFADEWDQTSFDPDYPTEPLAHFEPKVRAVFATRPLASDGAHPAAPLADPARQPGRTSGRPG